MAEEYFIRGPGEETAKGPYNIDALLTLAEASQLTGEHHYFDPGMESWVRIASNEALYAQVFPEKKALTLRKKSAEDIKSLNQEETGNESVKVEDMLAAAEGYTEDTRHVRTRREWRERTANFSVPAIGILLLISALSVLYPSWNIINEILNETDGAWQLLFQKPVVLLGALDLIMGLLLLLNATEIFPLIRFRALLGAGFFGAIYLANWINGDPQGIWMALSSVAFGIGLFICTLTLNFSLMMFSVTLGIIGALGLVWYSNLAPLLLQ